MIQVRLADVGMQEEHRAIHPKYFWSGANDKPVGSANGEDSRGKKRARAEDFLE